MRKYICNPKNIKIIISTAALGSFLMMLFGNMTYLIGACLMLLLFILSRVAFSFLSVSYIPKLMKQKYNMDLSFNEKSYWLGVLFNSVGYLLGGALGFILLAVRRF